MEMWLKNKKFCSLIWIILVIVLSFIFPFGNIQLAYAQQYRWHAGYLYYGYETYAHEGVYAQIYTINPSVPSNNFIAEWVAIVLSYTYGYWLQVGYDKGTWGGLTYYYEYRDQYDYDLVPLQSGPNPGTWHSYYIAHPYAWGESNNPHEWRFYIDATRVATYFATPYTSRDEQTVVETTTSSIIIDGSHFRELKYPRPRNWFWVYWSRHVPYVNPPYSLVEVSHYEFYANGGG